MQPIKTTAEIKKFGYEVGEQYTMVVSLDEKLKWLALIYQITIHPPREEDQLIKDTSYERISFKWFVLRSLDFREIKIKIDGDSIKKLVELKKLDIEKVGITLTAIE